MIDDDNWEKIEMFEAHETGVSAISWAYPNNEDVIIIHYNWNQLSK